MQNGPGDSRFFYNPRPEDIRSDLTLKSEDNQRKKEMFEIIDGVIKVKKPIETDRIITSEITSRNKIVIVDGTLRADNVETIKHTQITCLEFKNKEVINGDLEIRGDFNIVGDINWSGKTNYVDTEIIRAQDNIIYLNHKGTHQTSKNGGIHLVKGVDDENDCKIVINSTGYWNVYPGLNVPVLNVETINFEEEENGMLIGYLNGNKIGINYKKL
jgi:DNA polymerase II large subunit